MFGRLMVLLLIRVIVERDVWLIWSSFLTICQKWQVFAEDFHNNEVIFLNSGQYFVTMWTEVMLEHLFWNALMCVRLTNQHSYSWFSRMILHFLEWSFEILQKWSVFSRFSSKTCGKVNSCSCWRFFLKVKSCYGGSFVWKWSDIINESLFESEFMYVWLIVSALVLLIFENDIAFFGLII
jgi:hypothetical protein